MLLDDIALHLENQSVGTRGTSIFVNHAPDTPDALIMLQDVTPQQPEYTVDTQSGPAIVHYRFVVFTRSSTFSAAHTLAASAETALDASVTGVTLNGTRYSGLRRESPITSFGRDDRHRTTLTQTWVCSAGG